MGPSILPLFKRGIFENGILLGLENRKNFVVSKTRQNITKIVKKLLGIGNRMDRGMSMNGTIHTIFVIFGILCLMAFIIFTFEIHIPYYLV